MENKTINIAVVEKVAIALQELRDQMVFVGGAVISLYTDDPAADEVRPTKDIDITIDLASFSDWAKLQERLSQLKIQPDPEGPSICRYKYEDVSIDIIPAKDSPIGPANPWYKPGFRFLTEVKVRSQVIKILPAPFFLATKFAAFHDRGKDYRTSHDFEDIIYVIDNRTTIVEEIKNADKEVRDFLISEFKKLLASSQFEEILEAQIHPLLVEARLPIVIGKIKMIANE